jgi:hypothetical protein
MLPGLFEFWRLGSSGISKATEDLHMDSINSLLPLPQLILAFTQVSSGFSTFQLAATYELHDSHQEVAFVGYPAFK